MKLSVTHTTPHGFHESVIDKEFYEESIHNKCEKQLGHTLIEKMKNEGAISQEMIMGPNPTLRISVDCVYGEEYLELKNKLIEQDNRIAELEYALETTINDFRSYKLECETLTVEKNENLCKKL